MTSTAFPNQVLQTYQASITAWLPISTAWPLITQCSTLIYIDGGSKAYAWDPFYGNVINTNAPLCLPREVTSWWLGTSYSLGPTFTCPQAYTTATTSVHTPGMTEVFCCPSQYDLATELPTHGAVDYPSQCMSTLTSGDVLHYQSSTGGIMQPTSLTVSDTFVVHGQHVNGFNIDSKVFAQMTAPPVTATPTSASASAPASSSTSSSTTSTSHSAITTSVSTSFQDTALAASSSSAPLVSSSSQPQEKKKDDKSSTLAVAVGAGVGAGLAVLLMAGVGFWFWRRSRRNRDGGVRLGSDVEVEGLSTRLRGGNGEPGMAKTKAPERPMRMVHGELSAERRPGELDGRSNSNESGYWDPMKGSGAEQRVYEI
ncbi:LPXTG-motif cell wall anchor protein [Rutstroemia sp. NJR-2017a WRK4]|nr:LPXTG-motif cell wall anchor protein [Rutstroemia sp. NJR-2017a WRK4]